jgi:hypothetical protein
MSNVVMLNPLFVGVDEVEGRCLRSGDHVTCSFCRSVSAAASAIASTSCVVEGCCSALAAESEASAIASTSCVVERCCSALAVEFVSSAIADSGCSALISHPSAVDG